MALWLDSSLIHELNSLLPVGCECLITKSQMTSKEDQAFHVQYHLNRINSKSILEIRFFSLNGKGWWEGLNLGPKIWWNCMKFVHWIKQQLNMYTCLYLIIHIIYIGFNFNENKTSVSVSLWDWKLFTFLVLMYIKYRRILLLKYPPKKDWQFLWIKPTTGLTEQI